MKRWPLRELLLAIGTLSVASTVALSQSQAGETEHTPNIRTEVLQVLVPVVVTDKKGYYVTDLKASDFQVFEDGDPETIVAFSTSVDRTASASVAQEAQQTNGSKAISPTPVKGGSLRETYLVVVDTLHSSLANFTRARNALTKFFQQEHSNDSQYALMAVGRQIQAIHDSTRDPGVVLAALHSKSFQKMIHDSESSNTAFEAGRFTTLVDQYCKSCGCQTVLQDPSEAPFCATRTGMVQAFLTRFGERTYLLNEEFLRQVNRLVRSAASMPTSRTVIFLSDGFNRFPGQELYGILQGFGPNTNSFSFNPRDTQPELETVLRIASKYNVKFYTLDSRGLYTSASFDGGSLDVSHWGVTPQAVDRQMMPIARENTDVLAELAHQTGGFFFENNNDLLKGIRKAFADNRESYVLTYVPTNKKLDGKYRAIRVKVNGKGLVVNAKAGYWAIQ